MLFANIAMRHCLHGTGLQCKTLHYRGDWSQDEKDAVEKVLFGYIKPVDSVLFLEWYVTKREFGNKIVVERALWERPELCDTLQDLLSFFHRYYCEREVLK